MPHKIMVFLEQYIMKGARIMLLDRICLSLIIVGAVNWGLVGLFSFDLVAWICGGSGTAVARIIYTVIALAGLWCVTLLFRSRDEAYERN